MRWCLASVVLPAALLCCAEQVAAVRPDGSADCQEDNDWCGNAECNAKNGFCGLDWDSAKAKLATEDRSLEALA